MKNLLSLTLFFAFTTVSMQGAAEKTTTILLQNNTEKKLKILELFLSNGSHVFLVQAFKDVPSHTTTEHTVTTKLLAHDKNISFFLKTNDELFPEIARGNIKTATPLSTDTSEEQASLPSLLISQDHNGLFSVKREHCLD